eukprot:15347889-Ditylum_brightwellii.AAC.1
MYITFVILFIHADLRAVLDPLGNHVALPLSIPMDSASGVVLAGHINDLLFGMIVGGLSEVDSVEDYVYIPLDRSNN